MRRELEQQSKTLVQDQMPFHASAKGYWRDVLCCASHLQSHKGACERLPVYANDHQYLGQIGWVLEVGTDQKQHSWQLEIDGGVILGKDRVRNRLFSDCK